MVELDDRLASLRTQLEHASRPDFDDVLRRRRRHVRRHVAGAAIALAVVGAAVPVGLQSLPAHNASRDDAITPATNSPSTGPTTTSSTRPAPGPSATPSGPGAIAAAYPPLEPVVSDCGLASYSVRPATMALTCADGGIVATHLRWATWGAMAAEATGTATVRDCSPSCSTGKTSSVPIRLFLTSSKASDAGNSTTSSDAPVISVFDHATMRFTGNTPHGWSGPPVGDYPLDPGPFTPDQLAAATAVATFWDPAITAVSKAGMVAGGADPNDVRLAMTSLPTNAPVTVLSAAVSGDAATVTWRQSRSASQPSSTWSLSRLNGHWLIDRQAWSDLVASAGTAGSPG